VTRQWRCVTVILLGYTAGNFTQMTFGIGLIGCVFLGWYARALGKWIAEGK
jgi:hypothetical protein